MYFRLDSLPKHFILKRIWLDLFIVIGVMGINHELEWINLSFMLCRYKQMNSFRKKCIFSKAAHQSLWLYLHCSKTSLITLCCDIFQITFSSSALIGFIFTQLNSVYIYILQLLILKIAESNWIDVKNYFVEITSVYNQSIVFSSTKTPQLKKPS